MQHSSAKENELIVTNHTNRTIKTCSKCKALPQRLAAATSTKDPAVVLCNLVSINATVQALC